MAYGVGSLVVLLSLSGCSHSPDFNILGSYFPAWLLCITAGIVLTTVIYWLLQRMRLEAEVRPSIVVYPCMAAFLAFTLWLLLFSR
jgi:hypothetical protein